MSGRRPAGRILRARVEPGDDLVLGVEAICRAAGIERCFLHGSLGALAGASLGLSNGETRVVPGPTVEVFGLAGEVLPDAVGRPVATLCGLLATQDGTVVGGRILSGANTVSKGFEIILEAWQVRGEARATAVGPAAPPALVPGEEDARVR
jgi:predicted DNA-binding protein with PD1-like motif